MSVKKKSCIAVVTILVVMFILPLLVVHIVSSDAGMALCFILFFAVNPLMVIALSVMAGTELRKLWWSPLLAAVLFPVFFGIVVRELVKDLFIYSALYLAVGLLAMIGTHFGIKVAKRGK